MSKNKKKEEPRKPRPHKLPSSLIQGWAGKLHSSCPTLDITINTVGDICSKVYAYAYYRRMRDEKLFRDRREAMIQKDWNNFKDFLDDEIHRKYNQKDK
jgi:hypothetical protein